jgi:hypothetical protein
MSELCVPTGRSPAFDRIELVGPCQNSATGATSERSAAICFEEGALPYLRVNPTPEGTSTGPVILETLTTPDSFWSTVRPEA